MEVHLSIVCNSQGYRSGFPYFMGMTWLDMWHWICSRDDYILLSSIAGTRLSEDWFGHAPWDVLEAWTLINAPCIKSISIAVQCGDWKICLAVIWVISRVVFRIASRDISPRRCIRKSIDRLELIREYVLWQIGFFIETNQISKKTQILSPLPDREWHTSQCQGPSGRRLTSNQPVKISVPGSTSPHLCLYICKHLYLSMFGCVNICV